VEHDDRYPDLTDRHLTEEDIHQARENQRVALHYDRPLMREERLLVAIFGADKVIGK
jgi:hypothetical protein